MLPGILLDIVTSPEDSSAACNCTWFLSALTFLHRLACNSGPEGMGGSPPVYAEAPSTRFIFPKGVSRPSDWSTYQTHSPFSIFQVLGIGASTGSENPGIGT